MTNSGFTTQYHLLYILSAHQSLNKSPSEFYLSKILLYCHRTPSRMVWHIPSELIIEMQIITNRQQRAFQIWIRSDWEIRVLVNILTLDKMLNKPWIQLLCKPFQLAKCSAWPRSWMGEALYLIAQYEYCWAFLAGLKQFMRPARVSECESGKTDLPSATFAPGGISKKNEHNQHLLIEPTVYETLHKHMVSISNITFCYK